jgi:hypothetical protein
VMPAAPLALDISDGDETRIQERLSRHLSHVWCEGIISSNYISRPLKDSRFRVETI